jgi:predicted ATPase
MLAIRDVSIAGYRSLRRIRFPVEQLGVFVGPNGVGKTNLYRALQLVQAAAAGTFARELAGEGGMDSAVWAGPRRARDAVRIVLGVDLATADGAPAYAYEIAAGLVPQPGGVPAGAAFLQEPQVKSETLTLVSGGRRVVMLDRQGPSGFVRGEDGRRQDLGTSLLASETALGGLQDAGRYPEIHVLRQTMLAWRFYHDVRTDRGSPLRRPALAVTTPTLSSDGADLAAVFATLVHIRQDADDLGRAIDDAFPGARLVVPMPGRTATFGMIFPDIPSGCSSRPSSRTAPCATWRLRARCSATACRRSSPSTNPRQACTRTCSSPSHGSWYAPPSGRRSGSSPIPSGSPRPSPSTPGCCRIRW